MEYHPNFAYNCFKSFLVKLVELCRKLKGNSGDKHSEFPHFYKLDVSYAIQQTFSKVIFK